MGELQCDLSANSGQYLDVSKWHLEHVVCLCYCSMCSVYITVVCVWCVNYCGLCGCGKLLQLVCVV